MDTPVVAPNGANHIEIIDVRLNTSNSDSSNNDANPLRQSILSCLSPPKHARTLPTMLLYDESGLKLYDQITTMDPQYYYLFPAELEILKNHGDQIVRVMNERDEAGVDVVVELGAGALRKTSNILLALSRLNNQAPITYFALDLEKRELDRTLTLLQAQYGEELKDKVLTKGMWGTYEGGLKFIQSGGLADAAAPLDSDTRRHERMRRDQSPSSSSSSSGHDTGSAGPFSPTSTSFSRDTSPSPPSTPTPPTSQLPLHILFLGSTLGNFSRSGAVSFLRDLPLRPGSADTLLLGLDHDNEKEKVEVAYNDPNGVTRRFIMNGLRVAGRALGDENLFQYDWDKETGSWEYISWYDKPERKHEAFYKSIKDQTIRVPGTGEEISFEKGELVKVEESHKFSEADVATLFASANLRAIHRWTDSANQYSLWLLERPAFVFPTIQTMSPLDTSSLIPKAAKGTTPGAPTLSDFKTMWVAWDTITLDMIPPTMLFTKPIHLRHICLFYLGHIPTFLDIHLSRLLGEKATEPDWFWNIFERGIDPHVNDPDVCHPHSEVPKRDEDWPSLASILAYRDRVRKRVEKLYDDIESGRKQMTMKVARVLVMLLEHEGFHAETLLYMLLQSPHTLPPPGFEKPNWELLRAEWDQQEVRNKEARAKLGETVLIEAQDLSIGHNDAESNDVVVDQNGSEDVHQHEFGWDNENPKRTVRVEKDVKISWECVSNGEFYQFWKAQEERVKEKGAVKDAEEKLVDMPKSWIVVDGVIMVKTLYGPIPLHIARDWPVITSYDDLSTYAQVKGGRIPTEPELRLFLDKFESGYEGGSNVGFRRWWCVPPTLGTGDSGVGHNGGVWEWTSTLMDRHEGYEQSKLYPGYSSDFFDNHHHIVVGGSYATIPRLAGRRTLRNYYQHNYPFAWVSARIAYDVPKGEGANHTNGVENNDGVSVRRWG